MKVHCLVVLLLVCGHGKLQTTKVHDSNIEEESDECQAEHVTVTPDESRGVDTRELDYRKDDPESGEVAMEGVMRWTWKMAVHPVVKHVLSDEKTTSKSSEFEQNNYSNMSSVESYTPLRPAEGRMVRSRHWVARKVDEDGNVALDDWGHNDHHHHHGHHHKHGHHNHHGHHHHGHYHNRHGHHHHHGHHGHHHHGHHHQGHHGHHHHAHHAHHHHHHSKQKPVSLDFGCNQDNHHVHVTHKDSQGDSSGDGVTSGPSVGTSSSSDDGRGPIKVFIKKPYHHGHRPHHHGPHVTFRCNAAVHHIFKYYKKRRGSGSDSVTATG